MIDEKFIYIGAILALIGNITYAYNTVIGKTKPNRVTWLLWSAALFITFFAQLSEGVGLQVLMTFALGIGPFLIFVSSFLNKKAHWKITRLDIVCGILSALALVFWFITGEGVTAIILSIAADFLAGIPTLIKAYKKPETEHPDVFKYGAISALITLLTIKTWTFATYGFALYILLICSLFYVLIRFKIGKKISSKK